MSPVGFHKLAHVIFGITQKRLYISLSNLGSTWFFSLKGKWFIVPEPFFMILSIKRDWVRKSNFNFLKAF